MLLPTAITAARPRPRLADLAHMTRNWLQFRPIVLQFSFPRSPYASNITNIHNYYSHRIYAIAVWSLYDRAFFLFHFDLISKRLHCIVRVCMCVCLCICVLFGVLCLFFFFFSFFFLGGPDCSGVSPCEGETGLWEL